MTAYVIADIDVTDPATYDEYKSLTPATLAAHGGRFVVRGGASVPLEGGWSPKRMVVIEFDNLEAARGWYDSVEYEGPKAMRQASAETRMVIVEGTAAAAR